jgi:HAD superfamily phosphatase (TIGR01681 family)
MFYDKYINKNCELVIFDLDGTLHSFNDLNNDDNTVLKRDIIDILDTLKKKDIKIALVSLNYLAEEYLEKYNIHNYFDYIEYKNWRLCGDFKTDLFKNISEKSKIPFQKMLFFDDRVSHCEEASLLNIKSIYVNKNTLLSWNDLYNGMNLFNK